VAKTPRASAHASAKRPAKRPAPAPRSAAPKSPSQSNGHPRATPPPPRVGNGEPSLKVDALGRERENGDGQALTTSFGVRVQDDQNSLRAGVRGPSLLEDTHLREKITHFDHERIPERVVHARGAAAHGFFQVYEPMGKYTSAGFLNDPKRRTPVFVRFSTVAGSRGSTDLARDVRGFAVKFYTDEGNFDLVGNNIPVFFIQDAIKFPDFVHAVKPEPHNEMPQAASAHDTFWDFISLMPESTHMVMWVMSDRAIPRSYRMMEGFGVHTFRFINAQGASSFVKFHWKPVLGLHQVVWDEAQKISGKDPDFHRRDLWDAIATGNFPEWELGVQIVSEKDEHAFDFDLLDATKLIPEEIVPVQRIGKLTLDRNPDNFFAETEQVAFHVGHIVPGIDVTDDPLMQGRLFSYVDTQLIRLGGPNFNEIPINRPLAPVHTLQRDGFKRHELNQGRVSYEPNSLGAGCPVQTPTSEGGFHSFPRALDGAKVRSERSKKFFDHFTQARMFFISQAPHEQQHIVDAFQFELGKVTVPAIRERMVGILGRVDESLAARVAEGLGIKAIPSIIGPINHGFPAGVDPAEWQPLPVNKKVKPSPALSMTSRPGDTLKTRQVAILFAEDSDGSAIATIVKSLASEGVVGRLVGRRTGPLPTTTGDLIAEFSVLTASSVLFDAVFVAGGAGARLLANDPRAVEFVADAFKHYKTIGATGAGALLLDAAGVTAARPHPDAEADAKPSAGVVVGSDGEVARVAGRFVEALGEGRHWVRGSTTPVLTPTPLPVSSESPKKSTPPARARSRIAVPN
jgi:catalase